MIMATKFIVSARRGLFWHQLLWTIAPGYAPACQGNHIVRSRRLATSSARPVAIKRPSSKRGRQELLWRKCFADQTLWFDSRQDEKRFRPPQFRQKESRDVFWLDNIDKSAKLSPLDLQIGRRAPNSCSSLPVDSGFRPAGCGRRVTAETVTKLCQQGRVAEAVEALGVLVRSGSSISIPLFYTVLKKCVAEKDFGLGRRVHAFSVEKGYQTDTFLGTHILRMYAHHGRLRDAMKVFAEVDKPDAFMWSAIITAHVKQGQAEKAIQLYHQMCRSSVKPDGHVFVAVLQACARIADLRTGQHVHADVLASGAVPHLFVSSCLVDMYAKCGSLEEARRVFDGLDQKDVVTWNSMIAGYSQQGHGREALRLYSAMRAGRNPAPTSVTFVSLLQACASVGPEALKKGKQLHAEIRRLGVGADMVVSCSLVNMYAKCGSLEDAQSVFDGLDEKDVVTWNAMIAGYSQQGMAQQALHLYSTMQKVGLAEPDPVTFVCLLQACASVGTSALDKGKQLHTRIKERGLHDDVFVANGLVNMYAKCGSLEDARTVFEGLGQKDVVTWTSLIVGYSLQGLGSEALHLYSAMREEGISTPDSVAFLCLLQACAIAGTPALENGKQLHAEIVGQGLQADAFVANGLVNMYAKCGSLEDAQKVFDQLGQKDVVTWTALIAGYSQQGMGHESLRVHSAMREEGFAPPDGVTYVCLLHACANVAALHVGRQLHAEIQEQGLEADVFVAVSLINMYSKCGSMVHAVQVFDALLERDIVAWNTLIAGYARQGDSEAVFDLVHRMAKDGVEPDGVTFLSLLTVCSHVGLVDKGREYFYAMQCRYGITPTAEHYSCMVDFLGRAGQLDDALAVVRKMPVLPLAGVWRSLLAACQKWSNVEVGRHAFDEAVKLDEKDAAAYVLMSNIYVRAEMWEEAQEMQLRRKAIGAWKQPGQSWWTDMDGLAHTFVVGDVQHAEVDGIYTRLAELLVQMKKDGYLPDYVPQRLVCLEATESAEHHDTASSSSRDNLHDERIKRS